MSIESILNRLSAFAHAPTLGTEAALELEVLAQNISVSAPQLGEDVMCQFAELLEGFFPVSSIAARALLSYLANACLSDTNKHAAIRYGIPQTCVLYLQQYREIDEDTLYPLLDLITTLSSASFAGRRSLRPAIPYVIACMRIHSSSLEILYASCAALSMLAMLDSANSELVASQEGLQILVNAFRFASSKKEKIFYNKGSKGNPTTNDNDKVELCDAVLRWAKDALFKVVRTPSGSIDEAIRKLDFGRCGQVIDVDQLMWDIKLERKRVQHSSD